MSDNDLAISQLPAASAITGVELAVIVQDGNTKQTTVAALSTSPTYNVLDFNGGLFNTPANRRATIQAALNQVCSTGGTLDFPALAAPQDVTGGSITLPEYTAFPRKHTHVILNGNGINLISTSAHRIFDDAWPADDNVAVNRNVYRQFIFRNFNFTGADTPTPGQTFIRVIGSYHAEFDHIVCQSSGENGIDAIFCLNAVFRQCSGERNVGRTYWVRYGLDIDNANAPLWPDAGGTNSNGNVATFEHCEDYCRAGQIAAFAIDGTDQVTLDHPIWEGENPVDGVVYRQGGSTTTKSFSIIEPHPENVPSNSHIKLVGTGGGHVIIQGGSFTQGLIMMDASAFTTGMIHWHDQPFLSGKWKVGGTTQATWCFESCGGVTTDPFAASLWDGGIIPSYSLPVRRTVTGIAPENLGGTYPVTHYRGLGVIRTTTTLYILSDAASPAVCIVLPAGAIQTLWNAATNPASMGVDTTLLWKEESSKSLQRIVKETGGTSYTSADSYNHPPRYAGTGSPEGVWVAPIGSTYQRSDGGAGTCFYVKESGASNTGWVAK